MKNIYHSLKKVLVVALLMLLTTSFYAQETKTTFAPYWYLKASLGTSYGHTDLSRNDFLPDKDLDYLSFGGELGFGRQLTHIFGVNTKFYKGYLDGQLPLFANTKFETSLFDFTINGTVNLSNLISGYKDRKVSFHGLLGIGQTQFKAKSWFLGVPSDFGYSATSPGGGLGDRKVVLNVPIGFGLEYKINDKISANADVTLKWTDTDVLDAHPSAGSANDYYNYFSVGITYKLNIGSGIKKMVKNFGLITFKATPKVLEEKGNMVDVEITGTIPAKYFSKKAAIHLQPILKYAGGQTKLTPFTLKGENVIGDGTLIKNETGGKFTIKDTFKYTPAMNKSELVLVPIAYSAKKGTLDSKEDIINGTKNASIKEVKIADGIIYTSERIGKMGSIHGDHMYEKETIVTKKASVYFAKNLYNLNWKLKLNKAEKSKAALKELGDFVKRGWELKSIDVDGWASPEGEETFNENLSENRAKTTHKYELKNLKKMLKDKKLNLGFETIDEVKFNVNFHGQDWDGFTKSIKASNISDKNSIFNVITRAGSTLKKEEEIRNMIVIYPEIETEILPKLRRAEIAVNAYEPKKSDKEISALIKSDPSKLNIYEKLYAAHLAKSSEKLDIYKIIIKKHPKCWTSKNNAALIYMSNGEYKKAETLLNEAHKMYPKVPTIVNNLGILECNKGEYLKGEKYFMKAQDLGANVDYNLGVVEIHKGNYDKALKLFGNKTCDYNVALAQILTGNYAKAKNNLENAKGCEASNAYLMAVIGARTDNTSMLYKNLIKAVKAYPEFKKIAKEDREFIKYENTEDFKAIVK
jgi:tetratricopeptide (TPR) repeat protein